jgi:hypothetical protein
MSLQHEFIIEVVILHLAIGYEGILKMMCGNHVREFLYPLIDLLPSSALHRIM